MLVFAKALCLCKLFFLTFLVFFWKLLARCCPCNSMRDFGKQIHVDVRSELFLLLSAEVKDRKLLKIVLIGVRFIHLDSIP